jgi:hypothetical protein
MDAWRETAEILGVFCVLATQQTGMYRSQGAPSRNFNTLLGTRAAIPRSGSREPTACLAVRKSFSPAIV